mmetsp:Transcript_3056/g.4994  ORF Transcript_3056/g.4994 Transcript_3056/m.4994 type:complete len:82 (+) Transcript_3056:217-462(+)
MLTSSRNFCMILGMLIERVFVLRRPVNAVAAGADAGVRIFFAPAGVDCMGVAGCSSNLDADIDTALLTGSGDKGKGTLGGV